MRVLLVSPSYANGFDSGYFPLGLASIAAFAKDAGHEVHCLNFNLYRREERLPVLEQEMKRIKPDLVATGGLSVIMDAIAAILGTARHVDPKVITLVGGGGFTADPELIFRYLRPDFGVVGEGEESLAELMTVLDTAARPLSEVQGIAFWRDAVPVFTAERPPIRDLDALPDPDLEGFGIKKFVAMQELPISFNYHCTQEVGRVMNLSASRSCPYRCTFCFHPSGLKYRKRSIARVVDELFTIRDNYDVRYFGIYDELFDFTPGRIEEFCHALIDRRANVQWRCSLRVNKVTQGLLDLMHDAGCQLIAYGLESGSDRVLNSMRKRISTAQIARAISFTRQAKIGIQAQFLFGDPAETEETVQETLRFKQEQSLDFIDWSAVTPYPGTPLYHDCIDKGIIKDRIAFLQEISRGNTYLWNTPQPAVNMTSLPEERFRQLYLELREGVDSSHLRRTALLRRWHAVTPSTFEMTHYCRTCQQERTLTMAYPPEAYPDAPDPWLPLFGVREVNALCSQCRRKVAFPPWLFPGMKETYGRFRLKLQQLVEEGTPLAIMPAMDRYLTLFTQQIDLGSLFPDQVGLVFDDRPHRIGQKFFDVDIFSWDRIVTENLQGMSLLVLPSWNPEQWRQKLSLLGLPPQRIIYWQDFYQSVTPGSHGEVSSP
ncbi:MAG: cobalamin-dependent protein [Magnetococcales bacterium]|nr:cobalamin-dependent protein [Magnetococcales bacterium]